ncbi:hypothetical protein PMAYCL1PPCAC_12604, partial [Pristionchus mayeri]
LEVRIDQLEKSFGAVVKLKGEVKTRGRVQLYNENDPSEVILITLAVLIRILPFTPREYREAMTQTPATKRIHRLIQTEISRQNASTCTSPVEIEKREEERRKEVAEIVEKTITRRLMMEDQPKENKLSEEVMEMRRSLRVLGKEERNRREKGEDPPKITTPLTPPESPSSSSSSSSVISSPSPSSSSSYSSSKSDSSTSSSSSSSSPSSSSQESTKPKMSPTTAYIHNLREKIISESK